MTWSRPFFTLLELSDQVQFCLPAPFLFLKFIDVLCSEGKAQIINEELGEFSQKDIPVWSWPRNGHSWDPPRSPLRFPFQSACLPDFLVPWFSQLFAGNSEIAVLIALRINQVNEQSHFLRHSNRCCFSSGDQLSWVLGSWMQLKPQGLPVLSGNTAPVAFLTVRDDLATGQAGCCPGLMWCFLSSRVPAGPPPPEVTLIPQLWWLVPMGPVVWSKMEMLRGFGPGCVPQPFRRESGSSSAPLAYLPSHPEEALWVWRPWQLGFLPFDDLRLYGKPRK